KKTHPVSGSVVPALNCALAKASPKFSPTPITSPVERISGPSVGSTPGNLLNGNTGDLTKNCGTLVALLTYGTVRDALGLTSSTYTVPSLTAYCTFIRPITFSARASFSV